MLYPPGENSEKPYWGGGGERGGRWHPHRLSRPRISILVFAVLVTYCRRQRLSLPSIAESTPEGFFTAESDDDDYKKQNQIKEKIKIR